MNVLDEELDMCACTCAFIHTEHVMPGWGCCRCGAYNGLQRRECRMCKHDTSVTVPNDIMRCVTCGFGFDSIETVGPCPSCWADNVVRESAGRLTRL